MLAWTYLLLLGCCSSCWISPSLAAGTLGNAAAQAPTAAVHAMFTVECSPYQDWQAITLVYSYRKAGNSGPITRLLTCTADALKHYKVRLRCSP